MCHAKKGCRKPEELKGAPQTCSPQQNRKCHGDMAQHPCTTTNCEKPESLKGAPQDCSPKQIKKCHGDAAGHPCVESQ
jgi:hypothetical protein